MIDDSMKEESFDKESDANGNSSATGHSNEDVEPAHGRISAVPSEGDPRPSVQEEESPNGTRLSTCQNSTHDEDGKIPHHNPLPSQAVNSHQDKRRGSTDYSTQPGAVAVAGVKERNSSTPRGHQDSRRSEPQNVVWKATGTMVVGMDQGDTFSSATDQRIPNRNDTMVNQPASSRTLSSRLEFPEEENFGSTIVEAELVLPPIEAVRVSIDEDPSVVASPYHPFELEHAPSREHCDDARSKKSTTSFWLTLALVMMTAVCGTMIPYTFRKKAGSEGATPSTALPYGCYKTLRDILLAQISEDSVDAPTYVICPDTEIKIGTLSNPALDDYRYINGDYPILVIRENVTIQCGWDGQRSNNCVVNAGFMHVLTLQLVPLPDGSTYTVNRTNDNLLIRGITFTGILLNVEPFPGSSISLSHPGRNMRFEDCLWYNITAQSGLIDISRNYYQELAGLLLEDRSIEVTFVDCIFHSITYDTPLIFVGDQSINLQRCLFRDIQVSLLAQGYCRYKQSSDSGSTAVQLVETERGCASLLLCTSQSHCSMKDVCVTGMETWGEGIIVIKDGTSFNHKGVYWEPTSGRSTMNATCEVATISAHDWTNFTCSDLVDQPSCPLLP